MLQNAKPVGRRSSSELQEFDVGTADEPFILTDAQKTWRSYGVWDLKWFQEHLGDRHQLLKWLGPVFTRASVEPKGIFSVTFRADMFG